MSQYSNRVAVISGITGQDGSYLAELLLEKGYYVWGLIRRSSSINTHHIDHLYANQKLVLRYADLTDSANLLHIFAEIKETYPEMDRLEVYNLGAMSHVKVSFEMPEYTGNVDAIGVLRLLEAIRSNRLEKITRFYQASTSEMYGKVVEVPQSEKTPFYPRSPYGVAKLYGYWITKNYRESYNMFCSNGILFNHETLAGFMPLIFRQNEEIDIKPISEIVRNHTRINGTIVDETKNWYQEGDLEQNLEVWDQNGWTRVTFASGYPHDVINDNKKPRFIISKNAAYFVTDEHVVIMADGYEKPAKDIKIDDTVMTIKFPQTENSESEFDFINLANETDNMVPLPLDLNGTEAEFLGLMVAKGWVGKSIQFVSKSKESIERVKDLWLNICSANGKKFNCITNTKKRSKRAPLTKINLNGFPEFFTEYNIYNQDGTKRVPRAILNASSELKMRFLQGYALGCSMTGKLQTIRTDSATLAQGIIYLIDATTRQNYNIVVETVYSNGSYKMLYRIHLDSGSHADVSESESESAFDDILNRIGFLKLPDSYIAEPNKKASRNNSVKNIIDYPGYDGWFYDLTTESGTFHAGIGKGVIHNSPRRGPTFVTRKITRGLGMILNGERDRLVMGNLDSLRDWGDAEDYVYGMWLILQHDEPDDFVLATNEYHTVREFIEKSFALRGFDIKWKGKGVDEIGYDAKTGKELIFVSEKYYRPAEVDELLGDPSKAQKLLGWKHKTDFDNLIKKMVDADAPVK